MRQPNIDKVEIVEPPVKELVKRSSRFKLGCLTGCGFVLLLIVAVLIGLRLFVGPGPKTLKTVPENFPASIPLYDKDNISRITYITGRYKTRGLALAAIFPKLILSPLLLSPETLPTDVSSTSRQNRLKQEVSSARDFFRLLTRPNIENSDTIQIEWKDIEAEPSFVTNYYKNELTKKGFTTHTVITDPIRKQFSFENDSGVDGSFTAHGDEANKPGTDYAILTVNLAKQ